MTPCSLVGGYQCFRETYRLHYEDHNPNLQRRENLKSRITFHVMQLFRHYSVCLGPNIGLSTFFIFFFSSSRISLLSLCRHPSKHFLGLPKFPRPFVVLQICFYRLGYQPSANPQRGGPDPCLIFRFSRFLMDLHGYRIGHGAHEVAHRTSSHRAIPYIPMPTPRDVDAEVGFWGAALFIS
jgi:hypothetical protein